MCPLVDIDTDVFEYLQSRAQPFVDTVSDVLRRELGLAGRSAASGTPPASNSLVTGPPSAAPARKAQKKPKKQKPARTRAAAGTLLPEDHYVTPLLITLVEAGGQAPFRDVAEAVERLMHDEFLPADFENLNSGGVRWQNRLQFVRLRLVERGLLERDAPRGVWAISDKGRRELEERTAKR